MQINLYIKKVIEIMKRLLGFLVLVALVGCTCLSQVSTQYVYATETSCEASLPDYTTIVPVSDNCEVVSYTQTPNAGTLLTTTNPSVTVNLVVTDVQGNVSTANFDVILLDTIPPVFNFPAEMLSYTYEDAGHINATLTAFIQDKMLDWINYEPRWDTITFNREADPVMVFHQTITVPQEMYLARLEN